MKTIFLIRHAKSSWGDSTLTDFDRPLNDRGKADAPKMARRLKDKEISIDTLISSPAKRAKKTAEIFAETFEIKKTKIILVPELYHGSENVFNEAIANAPEKAKSIAIFSHNPAITDFVNTLTSTHIDTMPTCAVFAVKADIKRWKEFKDANKDFYFFEFPKSTNSAD